MVETPARVAEARSDVLGLEVGELVEHLCCTETGRQEVENVAHADSQATNVTCLRSSDQEFLENGLCLLGC
jgi:hypothetical protein